MAAERFQCTDTYHCIWALFDGHLFYFEFHPTTNNDALNFFVSWLSLSRQHVTSNFREFLGQNISSYGQQFSTAHPKVCYIDLYSQQGICAYILCIFANSADSPDQKNF